MTGFSKPVIEARRLTKVYRRSGMHFEALRDVSLSVEGGRTLVVVGESGAGKSTLSRILVGLERASSGEVLLNGVPLRLKRGRVAPTQMVFQDPIGALNPRHTVGRSIAEPLRSWASTASAERVAQLLEEVGLNGRLARVRPANLSGGQLQRVVLARALAGQPKLLVCDEPTSALDVSVQAQIVNLLLDVQRIEGFACIVVTHDLHVAKVLAHDILVLREGEVVESSPADTFFSGPKSAYGGALLAATETKRPHAVGSGGGRR